VGRRSYKVEKHWQAFNCECVVIMTEMGHRCGYVGIRENHPLYGVNYHEHSDFLEQWSEQLRKEEIGKRGILPVVCWDGETISPEAWFHVHGSITYCGGNDGYPIELPNVWWYGYDCGHCDDAPSIPDISNPQVRAIEQRFLDDFGWRRVVRTLEYCIEECENLAKQLNELPWMEALDHPAKSELREVMESANGEVDKWIKKRQEKDGENGIF